MLIKFAMCTEVVSRFALRIAFLHIFSGSLGNPCKSSSSARLQAGDLQPYMRGTRSQVSGILIANATQLKCGTALGSCILQQYFLIKNKITQLSSQTRFM